ncbi:pilus assembly protein PilP [Marinospirillum perlucidum]|uniref:pilus assembly protein PilP n=1 Tax=Marinospirillum perlucidum TaxID=1982602 RepID=UPI000DF22A13|nr:pilus assembly protein PilP [Marinospirillum perlucidum]
MSVRNLILLGLLVLFLNACSQEPRSGYIQDRLSELKERPSGQIAPLPDFPETPTPHYTQGNQRDPFTADRSMSQLLGDTDLLAPDPERDRSPLEQWSLEELSLRGIMRRGDHARALILTPTRELVSVRKGDYLGRNHGQIIAINTHSIQLVELIHDGQGNWQERPQELTLSR